MTRDKIAVTRPRPLVPNAGRAVREDTSDSVNDHETGSTEEKAKVDDLRVILDEMLAETGGPASAAEKRRAQQALVLRPRPSKP